MRKRQSIYLCEVVVHNRFVGRRFMLRNTQEIREFGLTVASVKIKARQKDNNILHGIRFIPVDEDLFDERDAIEKGYGGNWRDISAFFIRYPARFKTRSKPIIGLIMKGKYQGQRVALFSLTDISPYFPVESVRKSIIDNTTYSGVKWCYGNSHEEAEIWYQGECIQNDILLSLNRHRPRKRGWLVAGWKYATGYQTTMSYLIQAEKAFIHGDAIDGLVLLHKALGEYQTLSRRRLEDERVAKRFQELTAILAPNPDVNIYDAVSAPETRKLIKLLIRQLKRRE